jgi:hypothetical protein
MVCRYLRYRLSRNHLRCRNHLWCRNHLRCRNYIWCADSKKPGSKTTKAPVMGLSHRPRKNLAVGDVHRHFEAEAHFGEFRFGPHNLLQKNDRVYGYRPLTAYRISPVAPKLPSSWNATGLAHSRPALEQLAPGDKTTGESTNIVSDGVDRAPQKNHQLDLMIIMRMPRDIYPRRRFSLTSRDVQIIDL